MDIGRLLKNPEGPVLDFKRNLKNAKNIAITAIAFSNSKGGRIIVGYDKKKEELVGVKGDYQKLEEWVMNVVSDNCSPLIMLTCEEEKYKGKRLLIITLYPGPLKPYHLTSEGIWEGTYVRVGSTNRKADRGRIQELILEAQNISYDETLCPKATTKDLDNSLFKRYIEERQKIRGTPKEPVTIQLKLKLRAMLPEKDSYVPTVGGILVFGKIPQDFFPQSIIKCARFKGISMDEFIDQKEISGSLITMTDEALDFVKKNIRRGAWVAEIRRKERYEYPLEAIREAVINAIVHRDYHIRGSDIKLAIFDDCIEITSPGTLPIGMTIEQLGTGASETRNKMIATTFKDMGLIEEWGRGTRIIADKMKEWQLPPPKYEELGNFFRITLYGAKEIEKAIEVEKIPEQTILVYIRKHGQITRTECAKLCQVSSKTAYNYLNQMCKEGLLAPRGKGRRAHYICKEKFIR